MADQRMIHRSVICSDKFTDLSFEAQALYFQLTIEADNFGFVGGAKKIMRSIGTNENALTELEGANFVIRFDSGVFVIRHWMVGNGAFKNDRSYETKYTKELSKLFIDDDLAYGFQADSDGFQADSPITISSSRAYHISRIINNALHKHGISTHRDKEKDDDSTEQSGDCSVPPPPPDPIVYQDGKVSMTLREYLSRIPWATNRTWEMIQRFRGKMSDSLIRFAFDQTCEHGADFPDQYTLHILEDYAAKEFKTEADAERYENWRAEHLEQ